MEMKVNYYTGTGDMYLENSALAMIAEYAKKLSALGYVCRTGGGYGADVAFEEGAGDKIEIILPWVGYNGKKGYVYKKTIDSMKSMKCMKCSSGMMRNDLVKLFERVHFELAGINEEPESEFLLCYVSEPRRGCGGHAIDLANIRHIPVYNLAFKEDIKRFENFLNTLKN